MLLDSLKTAFLITFSLCALALAAYGIYRLIPLIGRPLVRRLFGLAYSEDDKALGQTGGVALLMFGLLLIGLWIVNCARERDPSGRMRTEWTSDQLLLVLISSLLEAILVEGMLNALTIVVPRFGRDVTEGERPIMVRSVF